MKENTDRYLRVLSNLGVVSFALVVLMDEKEDPIVAQTALVKEYDEAIQDVINLVLCIEEWKLAGIVKGTLMREALVRGVLESRYPGAGDSQPTDSQEESQDSQPSQTSQSSTEGSDKQWDILEIIDSSVLEDILHYEIEWAPAGAHSTSWEPWTLVDAAKFVTKFHLANPMKPIFGDEPIPEQGDLPLMPLEASEYVIYGQWFLETTQDELLFCSPSTNVLLGIVAGMEKYLNANRQSSMDTWQFINSVDEVFHDSTWDATFDPGLKRYKKYLSRTNNPSELFQKHVEEVRTLIPRLRSELLLVPVAERDEPHPRPWSEVGYTALPILRRDQHYSNRLNATTYLKPFIEAIASVQNPEREMRYVYQPISRATKWQECSYLESFFTRACQSLTSLGGINVSVAGKSWDTGKKMTHKESVEMRSRQNRDVAKMNAEKNKKQLEACRSLTDEKQKLETLAIRGSELEISFRLAQKATEQYNELEQAISTFSQLHRRQNTLQEQTKLGSLLKKLQEANKE